METCQRVWETDNVTATRAAGAQLGVYLRSGDVLALVGDLGAGKTAFTQGVAQGMGIAAPITSPTFVLVNRYRAPDGRILQHADCYRLGDAAAEMWDLGLTDFLAGDDIVIIEWADRILSLLPAEYLEVRFTYVDDHRRRLCFVAHGSRFVDLLITCYSH